MLIRVTRSISGSLWDLQENAVCEVSDEFARQLISEGFAVPVKQVSTMALEHGRSSTKRVMKHAPAS